MSSKNLIASIAVLTISASAHGGEVKFFMDFEDGQTGIATGTTARFSVVTGQGLGGGNALQVNGNATVFEGFIPTGAPLGGPGKVMRVTYDMQVAGDPFAQQRLYLLGTYSDENKANYRAMFALNNRVIDENANIVSYQVRNQADGSVIANPLAAGTAMATDTWYHIDTIINTDLTVTAGAFRGFSRVLSSDKSVSYGTTQFVGNPNPPDGVIYRDHSIQALQFYMSPNATFVGFGNNTLFDNLQVEYLNADDLTQTTRDAAAGGGGARSFFNNDGVINSVDADVFINQIMATRRGDSNFDRVVGFEDLLTLAQNFGSSGSWSQGDFDGDQQVGFSDLLSLAQNYGFGAPVALSLQSDLERVGLGWAYSSVIPEPAALSLALLAMLGACSHRRRA